MTVPVPEVHRAVLDVTGWATRQLWHDLVAGIQVRPLPDALQGTRVSLRLYPRTTVRGALQGTQRYGSAQPAREANTQTFEIVARLTRVEPGDNLLTVRVYPQRGQVPPFPLTVRATTAVFRQVDPDWSAVRLCGSLVSDLLVADTVQPIYAPVPERWADWVRDRSARRTLVEAPDPVTIASVPTHV
jgi:hypothetical protein